MLRECRTHGYFREEECPICGEKGRFLLNQEELDILGRTMAGVLRHFQERYNLDMDEHGWIDLQGFIEGVQLRQNRLCGHVFPLLHGLPCGLPQLAEDTVQRACLMRRQIDTQRQPEAAGGNGAKEKVKFLCHGCFLLIELI